MNEPVLESEDGASINGMLCISTYDRKKLKMKKHKRQKRKKLLRNLLK